MSSISSGTTLTTALVQTADTSGVLQLQTNGGTTALTLDTSQNATFAGKVASASSLQLATNGTTTALTLDTSQNATFAGKVASASSLQLATNGTTTAVTIDTSQNVGLGVTPSAWGLGTNGHALEFSNAGSMWNYSNTTGINLSQNVYYNGAYYYKSTAAATLYGQGSGQHIWNIAPSGTAGNAITFTQAMLLDASSNLTIAGSTATKASGTTWANPSDTRLKNNQALYTKGLTELNQIKVKTWVYNGLGGSLNGQTGIGVIADEAMIVLPDTVDTYSAKLNPTDSEETDIKRFNASEVIWLLVTSLQELDAKFESYKATHP
jgi:hypothetical protein